MSENQLFDYELPAPKVKEPAPEVVLVPRPPGYHLVTTRHGTVGFHRSRVPDKQMARDRSVKTVCGLVGRRVDGVYPDRIPLCDACESVDG